MPDAGELIPTTVFAATPRWLITRGIELMNAILDQSDALLDQLLLRHTDWRQAVLARFQLDYANWKGVNQILGPVQPTLLEVNHDGQ